MLRHSTVVAGSATLHVTESDGSGTPILFIHGTGSSSLAFGRQLESPLASRHHLLAVDLPGHGRSPDAADPAHGYTVPAMSANIAALIDQLKLVDLVICGWSLGGHIAVELIEHPAVAGLVLTGTPPMASNPFAMFRAFQPRWDMLLASKEQFTDRDVARFLSLCFPFGATPDLLAAVKRSDGRVRSAAVRSMSHGGVSDQKRAVETSSKPVAIIQGRYDSLIRLSYLETLRGLWRAGPQVLDNAGHAAFWDRPDAYNELLSEFADDAVDAARQRPLRRAFG